MFNIIEQQVKLNMNIELKEERIPNTLIVADCIGTALLLLSFNGGGTRWLWWLNGWLYGGMDGEGLDM